MTCLRSFAESCVIELIACNLKRKVRCSGCNQIRKRKTYTFVVTMQLDHEGIDDSQQKTINNRFKFDLEKNLKENGLSVQGYEKIRKDIENGDMNADILTEFDEDELSSLAAQYDLTMLQKKAFVKAVKSLPNCKANENDNHVKEKRIYITPKEQSLLNHIKEFSNNLSNYKNKCQEIDIKNKSTISNTCDKLLKYGNKIKQSVDIIINNLVKKVWCHLSFMLPLFFMFLVFCCSAQESSVVVI